jgi:hypothetical protein
MKSRREEMQGATNQKQKRRNARSNKSKAAASTNTLPS